MTRRALLIGGGHAHIEVVRRWGSLPIDEVSLTVIDPSPRPIYSGMVPGFVAGQYTRDELEIHLEPLCDKSNVEYVRASAIRIDEAKRLVECSNGDSYGFDVASIDIGSTVSGEELPGVAEFALRSRPMERLLDNVDGVIARAVADRGPPLHVVGSGAGGVELAFCLDARLRALGVSTSRSSIEIVTNSSSLLALGAASARRAVERHASQRGIEVHRNVRVRALSRDAIETEDGNSIESSGVVWVTGPAPRPVVANLGLPLCKDGYIPIDSRFRVRGHEKLFAVGDCASLDGMTKAGVYAVRAGPLVDENIRATLAGKPLRAYSPQRDFLSLLNQGNGEAVGTKWGVSLRGRYMMRLKDRIDRAFMEKYR